MRLYMRGDIPELSSTSSKIHRCRTGRSAMLSDVTRPPRVGGRYRLHDNVPSLPRQYADILGMSIFQILLSTGTCSAMVFNAERPHESCLTRDTLMLRRSAWPLLCQSSRSTDRFYAGITIVQTLIKERGSMHLVNRRSFDAV